MVIAIIALLMSILMPSLARVRAQAKATICKMNLKTWAMIITMKTDENDGYYICGNVLFPKSDVIVDHHPLDDMGDRLHLHIVPFYNY